MRKVPHRVVGVSNRERRCIQADQCLGVCGGPREGASQSSLQIGRRTLHHGRIVNQYGGAEAVRLHFGDENGTTEFALELSHRAQARYIHRMGIHTVKLVAERIGGRRIEARQVVGDAPEIARFRSEQLRSAGQGSECLERRCLRFREARISDLGVSALDRGSSRSFQR